jgi:hypothetical protein
VDYDNEDDPYKLVKAHSVQLIRLTARVEPLQSNDTLNTQLKIYDLFYLPFYPVLLLRP